MKKTRIFALAAAILLLAALCACDAKPSELTFVNKTGVQLHSIYISSVEKDEWADPVNYAKLSDGSRIHFEFDKVDGDGPGMYDIGAVDADNLNYDFYEVPLAIGDTITMLPAEGEYGTLTVTSADGTVTEYEGYCYEGEEQ